MRWMLLAATVVAVSVSPTVSHAAMTEAECNSAWTAADKDKDGFLSVAEGARYYATLRVADKRVEEGKLSRADFLTNCKAGAFDARKNDAGAPLKGANSFTEGQARDRAISYGFTDVSALTKDGDGIWRGSAQFDGKPVKVAIDYKGNVVSQ